MRYDNGLARTYDTGLRTLTQKGWGAVPDPANNTSAHWLNWLAGWLDSNPDPVPAQQRSPGWAANPLIGTGAEVWKLHRAGIALPPEFVAWRARAYEGYEAVFRSQFLPSARVALLALSVATPEELKVAHAAGKEQFAKVAFHLEAVEIVASCIDTLRSVDRYTEDIAPAGGLYAKIIGQDPQLVAALAKLEASRSAYRALVPNERLRPFESDDKLGKYVMELRARFNMPSSV